MNRKFFSILGLVSAISLFLIAVILVSWFVYFRQTQQTNHADSSFKLKPENYPRVETYQVPILMYHYIRDASGEDKMGKSLSVSPQNFETQMKWLKDNHFKTIKLSDLADNERIALSEVYGQGQKPIVLTFDDGYLDAYTQTLPILKKYDFVGTFFVITNYIGNHNYMDKTQIEELKKANMEIGSHTLTHPDLLKSTPADLYQQIFDSKDDTIVFCYPSGRFDNSTVEVVRQAGYVAAVTTKSNIATEKTNLLKLPRLRIEDVSIISFKNEIESSYK